jgi:hypothetical protein
VVICCAANDSCVLFCLLLDRNARVSVYGHRHLIEWLMRLWRKEEDKLRKRGGLRRQPISVAALLQRCLLLRMQGW